MSTTVELVLEGPQHSSRERNGRAVRIAIAAAAAVLLVSGCSSKNPDALTGMNLDENLAMMNAGDVNAADQNAAGVGATAANSAGNRSGSSPISPRVAVAEGAKGSPEVSAAGNRVDNSPEADEAGANQTGNDEDTPNASADLTNTD